jgi:hypothetical protein
LAKIILIFILPLSLELARKQSSGEGFRSKDEILSFGRKYQDISLRERILIQS